MTFNDQAQLFKQAWFSLRCGVAWLRRVLRTPTQRIVSRRILAD